MLSRGGASGGVLGSSKAQCAVKREGFVRSESNTLNTSASSRVICGNQNHACCGVVGDVIDLAGAVLVAALDADEACLRDQRPSQMPSGSIITVPRIGRQTWMIAQRFLKRRSASASPTISRSRRGADASV